MQALSFDLVLFGGTGDLAMRKLLPALYRRHLAGQLSADSRIICVARSEYDDETFGAYATEKLRTYLAGDFDDERWQQFRSRLKYQSLDANDAEGFHRLAATLNGREELTRIFFLSTAPNIFGAICNGLAASQIITPASRIVLEKPLGHDAVSAAEINSIVASIFREHQVYRIDHYLGKETVQNLLALRFGNTLFEPLWRRGRVRQVQITVAEHLGVEGRGNFYDQTGALRDMVQNHLLQLLCIIAMEPPASSDPNALRDEKLKVLRALRPLVGRDVLAKTVRGQYKSGAVNGAPVAGYLAEAGVPADSVTETFVAIKAEIDTWRWAGVPFYLRTGKRLQDRLVEISLTLEDVPHQIFEQPLPAQSPNRLVIRLQPDESITLTVLAKSPGEGMVLKPVNLSLDLAGTFKTRPLEAYERLLMDIVKGNLTLFMRRDELDAAWRWIDPIREAWQKYDERPKGYNAGTWGPTAASALLSRDGFVWHDEL
jgi:glucose-6-phosphate 1-dehydrogenase